MNRPSLERRSPARAMARGGFTLIEILMVMIIIGILLALLLPAVNSAMKAARRAAVSSEINQLAQALANFKSKYGDYPPSRFLAVESGNYSSLFGSTTALSTSGTLPDPSQSDPTSPGDGDITLGQLAQRSASALRKFWPRLTTNVTLPNSSNASWYDFNGNGGTGPDNAYILHGHECLVFFLGGVPSVDGGGNYNLNGFDKNPTNPFTNNVSGNTMYSANRQPPFFEFNASRLFLDPNTQISSTLPGVPAYYDSLGNPTPTSGSTLNFYAYFSAYGNGGYDPNDVNVPEYDSNTNGPIWLSFSTTFPIYTSTAVTTCESYAPNPYTSTATVTSSTGGSQVAFQNAQSFQIISSGIDGLYGVGGQYTTSSGTTAAITLPPDLSNTFYGATTGKSLSAESDQTIRLREGDNLTNFKAGTLQ